MTLLVLEVRVPEVPAGELAGAIAAEGPSVFAYVLTFGAIALTWSNHHTVWKYTGGYTLRLQWINLLLLLLVAFLPVPTAVLAHDGGSTAASPVFYALTVAGLELALLWVSTHARRHGLTVVEVEPDVARMLRRQLTVPPLVFLASCPVALAWPSGAFVVWCGMGVAFAVSNRQTPALLARHDAEDDRAAAPGPLSPPAPGRDGRAPGGRR